MVGQSGHQGAAEPVRNVSHERRSDAALSELAGSVGEQLVQRQLSFVSAESCTGGLVAKLATDLAGSSEWFDRAFVTYSNAAKQEMLGVEEALLESVGAVSGEVVQAMAAGALERSNADVAVAISGIAGPGGATPTKPVGTVWIAWASRQAGPPEAVCFRFAGNRDAVRSLAAQYALQGILEVTKA